MLFINDKNEYPRYIGDLQIDHPNWQIGDELPNGWREVAFAENRPEPAEDEIIVELFPVEENGIFVQSFTTRKLTAEELERKNAVKTAQAKLATLNLTEAEKQAIFFRLVRL